jgi:hypothetical protein
MAPSVSRDFRVVIMRIVVFKVRVAVGYPVDPCDSPGDDFINAPLRPISRRELPDLERSVNKNVVTLVLLLDDVRQAPVADDRVPVGMLMLVLLCVDVAVSLSA